MMYLEYWEIALRLFLATLLGLIFGQERKRSKKPVGARTHILVCLSACTIALISAYGFQGLHDIYPRTVTVNMDPARLVVGVLTGIGFLGAGIIWKSPSGGIQGITTAAEVFMLAALGIACGLGLYFLTGIAGAITIITMLGDDLSKKLRKTMKRGAKEAETEDSQLAEIAAHLTEEAACLTELADKEK